MAGPTVAGSIVAKLRVDDSAFSAELAAAGAKADELGRHDPTIKVDVDSAAAIAKMATVEAAEQRVDIANQALRLSYLRLDEAQNKGGLSASKLAALHLAASRAEAAHESATKRLAAAQLDLAAADDVEEKASTKVVASTLAKAAADDTAAASADKAAASNGVNVSRMGLIIGAVSLLVAMGAPLSGFAIGVAGALAGMGAAGVLAILGIKNAMADGTAAGNTYSAGLQILLGDLHQLEATAAANTLNAFAVAVSEIDSSMPELNREIGLFSKQLGVVGDSVLQGVLTAFKVLNPLFLTAGVYVEQLAVGFQRWTQGSGLQQFAQMATAALPQVAQSLGSLLKGALDLIAGLTPLGTVLLGTLTVLGQFLSVISPLVAALTPLAIGVGVVYGGFMLWKQVSPVIQNVAQAVRGFGVDLTAMLGVAGLAVAALAYIASSFVTARMASIQAAQALEDYTAAVQQDNGVLGENVRQQTAKALADKNSLGNYNSLGQTAIQVGQKLGLTAKTVADASLGNRDAVLKVNQAMTDYANNPANSTAKVAAYRANWDNLTGVIADNQRKIQDAIHSYNDIASAQGLTTIKTKEQLLAQTALAASYGMSLPAYLTATATQKSAADQLAATTQAMQLQNDAAGLLTNAITILNGGALSLAQAQTGQAAALNATTAAFTKNGDAIDGGTVAAVANQQALEAKVAADQQAAEATAKATGSTAAGTQAYMDSKAALEAALKAQDDLTPAVQAYIDKLYDVANLKVPPTKLEVDNAQALAAIAAVNASIGSIERNINIAVTMHGAENLATTGGLRVPTPSSGGTMYKAAGGAIDTAYLANGGSSFAPHGTDTIPAMLTPGEFVIKEKSASYNPAFLKAYNSDPRSALSGLGGGGADRPIYMDGGTLFGVIREMANGEARLVVNAALSQQGAALSNGMRPLA